MASPTSTGKRKREDDSDGEDGGSHAQPAKARTSTSSSSSASSSHAATNGHDASASSSSAMSITMSPITGVGLSVPTAPVTSSLASAVLHSPLPSALPSFVLPLPFASPTPSFHAAVDGAGLLSPVEPSPTLISLVDQYAHRLHVPPPHARLTLTLISGLVAESASCACALHANVPANHVPWIACCIFYSLLILSPAPPLPSSSALAQPMGAPSLTHVLITCALPLPVFLKHLSHLSPRLHDTVAALGLQVAGAKERVAALMTTLLLRVALFKKFERVLASALYPEVKALEDEQAADGKEALGWRSTDLYGCAWLLYLAAKGEVGKDDLHSLYVQLLSVCSLLLTAVLQEKDRAQRRTAQPASANGSTEEKEPPAADVKALLASSRRALCTDGGVVDASLVDAVTHFHDDWLQRFLVELREAGSVTFSVHPSEVFAAAYLQANITMLGHLLDARTPTDDASCEYLDERIFLMDTVAFDNGKPAEDESKANGKTAASHRRLFTDPHAINGSADSSPALDSVRTARSVYSTPLKLTSRSSPHHAFSPSLRGYPSSQSSTRTPITRMMEAVSWLTTTFSSLSPSPSAALLSYFASLSPNPLPKLLPLVASLHSRVVLHDLSSPSSFSPDSKRDLALKIYWLVIEHMTVPPSSPPAAGAAAVKAPPPAWLVSRQFHSALLCVCFELIFFAYRHALQCFPQSLHVFGLTHFELLKVLDTAMKRLPTLPASLRAHLCSIEVSAIERLAWGPGEKAVEMMKDEAIRARVEAAMKAAINSSSKAGAEDKADGSSSSSSSSSSSPTARDVSPDFSALLSLYRRLFSLCAERLSYLSSDLALSLSTRNQQATWTLLVHVLLAHPSLLFHRHVDTLLLCSLYTIAVKICHGGLDFKRIVHVYLARWDGQAAYVVRDVEGRTAASRLDVIAFYNDCFIPAVKDFALGTLQPILLAPLPSPTLPPLSPLPMRSRLAPVNPHPNIFISPMRHSQHQSPREREQRVLSAVVGESPTKRLAEMNAMLEGRKESRVGRTGAAGTKALFTDDSTGVKRSAEQDGVAALLLASRVNGHRESDV